MTSSQDFRRPDDVSPEEEKRLVELFDECVQKEGEKTDADQLTLDFRKELGKLNIDEASRDILANVFVKATDDVLSERDGLRFISTLQKVATRDLTNEEHNTIKRLEFIFAVATTAAETRKRNLEQIRAEIELEMKRLGTRNYLGTYYYVFSETTFDWEREVDEIKHRSEMEDCERSDARSSSDDKMPATLSDREKASDPITKFKIQVLWDVLGDERPQNLAEFRRVLLEKGILLRHSS